MKKSEELYVKHHNSSGTDQDEDYSRKMQNEVVINEVNYREKRDFRRQRYDDKCKKLSYRGGFGKHDGWNNEYDQTSQANKVSNSSKNSEKSLSLQPNSQECHVTWTEPVSLERKSDNSNNRQTSQANENNISLLKGSYTQIMVNPMQLNEHEFTNWMEKLMEA